MAFLNYNIGEEETCLKGDFIQENFYKYKNILGNLAIITAIRWYQLGKVSFDDADAVICFITALEAISDEKEVNDKDTLKEIDKIKNDIKNLDISDSIKERAINAIENLKRPSFKEKMAILLENLVDNIKLFLKDRGEELDLFKNGKEIIDLLGEIYSKRSKILHSGKITIKEINQIRKWLEIFCREIIFNKINQNANSMRENN